MSEDDEDALAIESSYDDGMTPEEKATVSMEEFLSSFGLNPNVEVYDGEV